MSNVIKLFTKARYPATKRPSRKQLTGNQVATTRPYRPGKTRQPSPPLTRHRLFPPLVTLWFGALFGLGSLAMRPLALEAAILALRIDRLLPLAAPPLGLKARVLLALAMAVLGGVLGLMLARRLARTEGAPRPAAPVPAQPWAMAPARRRTVSAAADRNAKPTTELPYPIAPLPGRAPPILDVRECDFVDLSPAPVAERASELREAIARPPLAEPLDRAEPQPPVAAEPGALKAAEARPLAESADAPPSAPPAQVWAPAEAAAEPDPMPVRPAIVLATASPLALVNHLALIMQDRQAGHPAPPPATIAERARQFEAPPAASLAPPAPHPAAFPPAAAPVPAADPAGTEAALRSALFQLQRLSSAA